MPHEWRETLASRYLPGLVVAPRPATDDELGEAPSIWAAREATDGEPTVYAARTSPPFPRDRVS
ncbi:thioredoxin domain-containing protein (plasmid) [Haloferax mediterranei ATCC 33500]|nr:thioredoxin domain-containing protein [Haloferax mediterranei ATCC 33500]